MSVQAKEKGTRAIRRLWIFLASLSLALGTVVGVASPAQASAPVILSGSAWLNGQGVNVCGASTDPYCGDEYHVGGWSGNWWQCVELAQRLYQSKGWHGGIFANVSYAYQIYDQASALGMNRQANGSITSIVPGDMIIHGSDTPYSWGAGHVSIVESVNGSTVNVVEQNTYNNDPTGQYTFSGGTLARSGTGTIRGIVHDPNNQNTTTPPSPPDSDSDGTPDSSDECPSIEGATANQGCPVRDFNGNGRADILWYGPGSDVDAIWYGAVDRSSPFNTSVSIGVTGTYTPITGDFDGDDKGDILWYGPGSAVDSLWYGTSTGGEFVSHSVNVSGTYTPIVGDFNGNGRDDILWYGPGSDVDAIWYGAVDRSAGFNKTLSVEVAGTYTPISGDFDGDSKWDILWYGPGSAVDALWYGTATGGNFSGASVNVAGTYTPIAGDFNGNKKWDILWYGPGADTDAIWHGNVDRSMGFNKTVEIEVTGIYTPVSGDFDGNGKADILWYGPGDDHDALWYGTATGGEFVWYPVDVRGVYTPIAAG